MDLSIIVATYNQEKYIKQAIDSILMQKVNFEYEVLIGEDASTDNTKSVLKNMENDLPPQFHIFYREKNMGDFGNNNFADLFQRAKGRYLIVLEGDDYWTYEYKLQKQYDFLENHPDFIADAHNTKVVGANNEPLNWKYPECKKNIYSIHDYLNGILPGQTATLMYRNYLLHNSFPHEISGDQPGDQKKAFLLVVHGKIYCFQQQWSAYRFVFTQGSSFSARTYRKKYDFQNYFFYIKSLYLYTKNTSVTAEASLALEKFYGFLLIKNLVLRNHLTTFTILVNTYKEFNYPIIVLFYVILHFASWPQRKIKEKFGLDKPKNTIGAN